MEDGWINESYQLEGYMGVRKKCVQSIEVSWGEVEEKEHSFQRIHAEDISTTSGQRMRNREDRSTLSLPSLPKIRRKK